MENTDLSNRQHRKPGPRLYHKKSRLGCLRCKARRVKCDESRPACSGCARHLVECIYTVNNDEETSENGFGDDLPTSQQRRSRPRDSHVSKTRGRGRVRGGSSSSNMAVQEHLPSTEAGLPAIQEMGSFLASGGYCTDGKARMVAGQEDPMDPAESRSRRRTELRLLHHYLLQQSRTFGHPLEGGGTSSTGSDVPFVWSIDLVSRALENDEHDCILYVLLAHSALSLWVGSGKTSQQEQTSNRQLHQQYLALALRAQRLAVAALVSKDPLEPGLSASALASNQPASESSPAAILADTVGTAALLLVNHSFALVQTLPLEPWQPPHEWLQMGRGAMQVMEVAKSYLPVSPRQNGQNTNSLVLKLIWSPPYFDAAELFAPVWAAPYLWLLEEPDSPREAGELDERNQEESVAQSGLSGLYLPGSGTTGAPTASNDTAFKVYYDTLSYIGWCAAAATRHDEPINAICRRFAGAAYWFPRAFEDRLRERRPRAMVCLAHYFALWIPFEETATTFSSFSEPKGPSSSGTPRRRPVWMMGSAGRRQVAAIHAALPDRWKGKVAQLLTDIGDVRQ